MRILSPVTAPTPKAPRARRRSRAAVPGAPEQSITPSRRETAAAATLPAASEAPISPQQLDAVILRHLRRYPNRFVDLNPLAEELALEPERLQLALERLARRRMVTLPFIEPGRAGGAELTEVGLRWLIAQEGGSPADTPVALQPSRERIRPEDEAARLPRAEVYGVNR